MKRRKKRSSWALIFPVILLSVLAVAAYYISEYYYHPSFAVYKGFGISLPVNYSLHGIDVSRYQETISWEDVKNMKVDHVQVGFAFIKATEGVNQVDPQFRRNWFNVARCSIPRGAYHYFKANANSVAQAKNFLQTVRLKTGDLPPVLDVEESGGLDAAILQQKVYEWILWVEKKCKVRPIIYTNVDFYENFLQGRFDAYPLWIAHYIRRGEPRINRDWNFWQHSESGHLNGVRSYVDFNVFNGDSISFQKMLIP